MAATPEPPGSPDSRTTSKICLLSGGLLPVPTVSLEQPSPRVRESSGDFCSRETSADGGSVTLSIPVPGGSLQVPHHSVSNISSRQPSSCNLSAFAGSVANSVRGTVDVDLDAERALDFDDRECSGLDPSVNTANRIPRFGGVVVRYLSAERISSFSEEPAALPESDPGSPMFGVGLDDVEALLEVEEERRMQRFSELRSRQLEFLEQSQRRLRGRAMGPDLRCGRAPPVRSDGPRSGQKAAVPTKRGPRPWFACCGPPPEPAAPAQRLEALAARWEVFRNAVVQAYGPNSLAWPEEIKYTYAVCFNRILGEVRDCRAAHPAFPSLVPFDLSCFDKGSLRTERYGTPRRPDAPPYAPRPPPPLSWGRLFGRSK
eukprot:EG_transcript_9995